MDIKARLAEHLRQFHAAPFLFVGSGVSRRYLNLETWENLLGHFATLAGLDPGYYISKANSDLPQAASLLAGDFHEVWWKSPRFKESREKDSHRVRRNSSALKVEICEYLKQAKVLSSDPKLSAEIAAFKDATVDGIITTNWDLLLEQIFPSFEVYKSQQELLFSQPQSIAEIYKIHGCCSQPESLVLTAEDYAVFRDRNPYLAAKLLAVFIEHPVIFMGYSLSDPNIYSILESITGCLDSENLQKLQQHLVFIEWQPTVAAEFSTTALAIDARPLPVTLIRTNSFIEVAEALAETRRCFPARLLRRLKKHVYELVKSNDPDEQMHVLDIEEDTDDSKVEIVYGVGVTAKAIPGDAAAPLRNGSTVRMGEQGYRRLSIEQILRDVVYDNGDFEPDLMVKFTLPDLLTNQRYAPIFKYLHRTGFIGRNAKDRSAVDPKLRRAIESRPTLLSKISRSWASERKQAEVRAKNCTLIGLARHYDVEHQAMYIPLLEEDAIALNELEQFLRDHFDTLYFDSTRSQSALKKLIAIYDFRRFSRAT